VQPDLQRVLADLFQRSLRHADVGALDLVALLLQRLDDVVVGDRAEQAAVGARLLRDLDRQAVELRAALLRLGEDVGLRLFQLGAARLERLQVVGRGALRLAVRDEEVAGVAVLHFHDVAKLTQVGDFFHEDDLHQCRSV